MSTFSGMFGGGTVKSVQRGTAAVPNSGVATDVTISAIDTSKSVLLTSRGPGASGTTVNGVGGTIKNSTTITLVTYDAGSAANRSVYWEVLEYA